MSTLPPLVTYGQTEVARWCGVRPSTVAAWLKDDDHPAPEPDAKILSGKMTYVGWLPSRRQEWLRYAAARAELPGARLVALRKDREK